MNYHKWHDSYQGFIFGSYMTKTVKIIIIINVAVFTLIHLIPQFPWLTLLGLVPAYVFGKLMVWQLITYMFLHAGLWHLVVNMLMLWFFGPAIENSWGTKRFLQYYFFTGIGAGICSFITAFHSVSPVIGASGAIFGILVAYAMMFPDTVILLFFFFPMKIKHAVLVMAGINLLGALSAPNSGIAYFAHLGGGLFGFLYLKNEWIRTHIHWLGWSNIKKEWSRRHTQKNQLKEKDIDEQVDIILDKISKHGIDSLTKEERKILKRKSKGDA